MKVILCFTMHLRLSCHLNTFCHKGHANYHHLHGNPFISSPEHKVLMVSYCDHAVSVVNFLPCVHSRGYIFSPHETWSE